MALETMYSGQVNSPQTTLSGGITGSATTITVADASILPDAPMILVIGGETDNPETVLMTAKNGNDLTVTRALEGTAQAWGSGSSVGRNFTNYDYQILINNIEDLSSGKVDKVTGKGLSTEDYTSAEKAQVAKVGDLGTLTTTEKSNLVGSINEVDADLAAHKADYEQYLSEELQESHEIRIFPDGTKDGFDVDNQVKIMKVSSYIIKESDLTLYTGYSETNMARIPKMPDGFGYNSPLTGWVAIDGIEEYTGSTYNSADNIGKFTTRISGALIDFFFSKSTTLEQAKTALVGKELIYKLAITTNVPLPEEQTANTVEVIRLSEKVDELISAIIALGGSI